MRPPLPDLHCSVCDIPLRLPPGIDCTQIDKHWTPHWTPDKGKRPEAASAPEGKRPGRPYLSAVLQSIQSACQVASLIPTEDIKHLQAQMTEDKALASLQPLDLEAREIVRNISKHAQFVEAFEVFRVTIERINKEQQS